MTAKINKTVSLACLCALLFLMNTSVAWAAEPVSTTPTSAVDSSQKVRLEDYLLMALSATEEVAVLKGPNKQLVTVRVGSALAPAQARLVQVLGDRLRFEAYDSKGARETVWMIRAASPEQPPEVQRISGTRPAPLAAGAVPASGGANTARASDSPAKKK